MNSLDSFISQYKDVISGIGMSAPGRIDNKRGYFYTGGALSHYLSEVPLGDMLSQKYSLPVAIDNDAKCAANAELWLGALKDVNSGVVVILGTGIGGAIVFNGKIWRGLNYNAGEVGRMLLPKEKFEELASVTALIKNARDLGLDVNNGKEIFELYDQDNFLAKQAIASFYHYLAVGIANLIYTFNPEAFVIGGGITNRDGFLEELNKTINRYLVDGFKNTAILKRAHYKNDGGMMGAYYNFVYRNEDK